MSAIFVLEFAIFIYYFFIIHIALLLFAFRRSPTTIGKRISTNSGWRRIRLSKTCKVSETFVNDSTRKGHFDFITVCGLVSCEWGTEISNVHSEVLTSFIGPFFKYGCNVITRARMENGFCKFCWLKCETNWIRFGIGVSRDRVVPGGGG